MSNESPRAYSFDVTETTIAALRQLRQPWRGWLLEEKAFKVGLDSNNICLIRIDRIEVEPGLQVSRLQADLVDGSLDAPEASFSAEGNDVVLFNSEFWTDGVSHPNDGPPGSCPDGAVASC